MALSKPKLTPEEGMELMKELNKQHETALREESTKLLTNLNNLAKENMDLLMTRPTKEFYESFQVVIDEGLDAWQKQAKKMVSDTINIRKRLKAAKKESSQPSAQPGTSGVPVSTLVSIKDEPTAETTDAKPTPAIPTTNSSSTGQSSTAVMLKQSSSCTQALPTVSATVSATVTPVVVPDTDQKPVVVSAIKTEVAGPANRTRSAVSIKTEPKEEQSVAVPIDTKPIRSAFNGSMWECSPCKRSFKQYISWRKHAQKSHSQYDVWCPATLANCQFHSPHSRAEVEAHIRSAHPNMLFYRCKVKNCHYLAHTKQLVVKHLNRKHVDCPTGMASLEHLIEDNQSHRDE